MSDDLAPDCFICRKQRGEESTSPGGYLYADARYRVCHAPAAMALPGTLIVESRRHFLDFAEMTPEEAACYGPLLARLYAAIRSAIGAERIYALVTLEGAVHFHTWLVPRLPDEQPRGVRLLAAERSCSEEQALTAAEAVRAALG